MCIIIDANMFSAYCDANNSDMKPVRKWVEGRGNIVYSRIGRLGDELKRHGRMQQQLAIYRGKTNLELVGAEKIRAQMADLENQKLESNDEHIIALAKASGATLLVSADAALGRDFKKIIKGKIYKNESHRRLLINHQCPSK